VFESSPHGRVRLKRHRPRRAQSSTFECGRAVEGGGDGGRKDGAQPFATAPWVTDRARGQRWATGCSPTHQTPVRSPEDCLAPRFSRCKGGGLSGFRQTPAALRP
jgi:hypothetical protein